jgi:hypothetical protein
MKRREVLARRIAADINWLESRKEVKRALVELRERNEALEDQIGSCGRPIPKSSDRYKTWNDALPNGLRATPRVSRRRNMGRRGAMDERTRLKMVSAQRRRRMTERINSRIFGVVQKASPEDRRKIEDYAVLHPVDVFQALNTLLNARGLMIGIRPLQERTAPTDPDAVNYDIMNDPRIRSSGPVGDDAT